MSDKENRSVAVNYVNNLILQELARDAVRASNKLVFINYHGHVIDIKNPDCQINDIRSQVEHVANVMVKAEYWLETMKEHVIQPQQLDIDVDEIIEQAEESFNELVIHRIEKVLNDC
ncbi:hypothetical protein ACMG5L_21425 [Escherichia coli]|uniref:hypothetical protein n=1 Tax=Escherichia coli TaxID=562 RepID=UPI0039BFE584